MLSQAGIITFVTPRAANMDRYSEPNKKHNDLYSEERQVDVLHSCVG